MFAKILIADDDALFRLLIARMLRNTGAPILHASDGIRARTLLEDNHDIDLLIADVFMPCLDGPDVLASLRRTGIHAALPVLLTSATVDWQEIESDGLWRAYLDRRVDFLKKPFTVTQLVNTLTRLSTAFGASSPAPSRRTRSPGTN